MSGIVSVPRRGFVSFLHVVSQNPNRWGDPYGQVLRFDTGTCAGDIDHDGDVDLSDLAQLLGSYGLTSGATCDNGDVDIDEDVDVSDLAELLARYGSLCE